MEYPLEEDVLFDQPSADISLVNTAGNQAVNEELVYTFRDVREIHSLWLALPKSLIASVDSVTDFYAICELSGLEVANFVIQDVDPLIEMIRLKIEEVDAALATPGKILDIDPESSGAVDELIPAVEGHAQSFRQMHVLRQELDRCPSLTLSTDREREAHERMQGLFVLYPDFFCEADCDRVSVKSQMTINLCLSITSGSGTYCQRLPDSAEALCRQTTFIALARKSKRLPSRHSRPSPANIPRCLR